MDKRNSLHGISICVNPNFVFLGMKFDHVHGIGSHLFRRIGILSWSVFWWTPLLLSCYHVFVLPILEYISPVWEPASGVLGVQALPCSGFLALCDIIMLLDCVCSTRLIQTRIIVCSVSFHLLLPEFDIKSCGRSSFIGVQSYQGVERPIMKVFLAGLGSCVEWPSLHCFRIRT